MDADGPGDAVDAWDPAHADGADAWDPVREEDAGDGADAAPWPQAAAGGELPGRPGEQRRPATGEPRVDAALARLDELAGRPVTEHRAVFEDVHRRLRDVLGELDTRERQSQDAAGADRRPGR
jgi:hypothetical protein